MLEVFANAFPFAGK